MRSQLSNTSADDLSQMKTGLCCAKCNFVLDERMCEFMDCIPEMQPSVSVNNRIGLHSRVYSWKKREW